VRLPLACVERWIRRFLSIFSDLRLLPRRSVGESEISDLWATPNAERPSDRSTAEENLHGVAEAGKVVGLKAISLFESLSLQE
jgi:hypothetical protein